MPSRVPMRIKLIAALLALVVIALAVISMVGLAQFRSYLQDRADAQLSDLMSQALQNTPTVGGPPVPTFNFSGYVIELRDLRGNLVPGWNQSTWQDLTVPGPSVPITQGWLSANAGKTVTVPAVSGGDTWRVLVRRVGYRETSAFGQGPNQPGVLIVGADLGHLDQAVGWLAKVDLVISAIIVVALAIVGVAMVRASLRPLTDIENTAQAIAAGDLSRRVPDHDPRTEMGRLARSLNAMLAQIESAFRARAQSEAENGSAPVTADAAVTAGAAAPADPAPADAAPADAVPADAAVPASRAATEVAAMAGAAPGSLATATGDHGPLTRPEMNRIMERVEQESFRMGGLVEDMLVLARLDQQRPIERRPVDLLTLAADAVQDARIVAPSRSIDLTVGTGAAFLVLGDEGRLRQVISNLMTNALTHTPDGSPITVRILAGHQQGNPAVPCAIIEVADLGPGLTPEQASRVFERFYRADQARLRRTGGSGLGLAIVAALVAAHGGTASVDTAPGQGATFRITLPLAPDALATEPVAE